VSQVGFQMRNMGFSSLHLPPLVELDGSNEATGPFAKQGVALSLLAPLAVLPL
jgi:hypothetical protein